jgi:hypothetical protein
LDVFVDESGDFGFSHRGGSQHIVMTAMATDNAAVLGRLAKRARRKMSIQGMTAQEFKFKGSSDWMRFHFLRGIAESNCEISWVGVRKENVCEKYVERRELLYQLMCRAVLGPVFKRVRGNTVNIVFDRRTEKWLRGIEFDLFVGSIMSQNCSGAVPPRLRIRHVDSRRSPQLQANDFVTGALFQLVERENACYYDVIGERVVDGTFII